MLTLPAELLLLIVEFAPLFSKPVGEHAKVVLVGVARLKSGLEMRILRKYDCFDAQDDIDRHREQLIAEIEGRLEQKTTLLEVFLIRWRRVSMAKTLNEIENDAMKLSREERAVLVEHLITTLDVGEDVEAEELWLQEAEKRYQGYRTGRIASKPAAQVFADAKKSLQ